MVYGLIGCNNTSIREKKENTVIISGNKWYTDIPKTLLLAKKEKKNVLVMVSEESCRWCIKMEEKTLTEKKIQQKLGNYLLVSVKRSDVEAVKHLSGFDGNIPSFFFMEHNSDFVESIIGYYDAPVFLEYLTEIENDL